ncbi:transposase [Actinomadura sp. LOL_016]|uniref:transposase n=1 Tax=Actinomadura sp. LOL_016 TaxID=3345411 RepID=UPI003A87045E
MPPQILAAAIALQSLHGLSDFETVQELRCDLRWKAACGLAFTTPPSTRRCWPTSAAGWRARPGWTACSRRSGL